MQLKIDRLWPLFLHLFPYSFKIYLCSHYFIKFSVDEVFFCFLQAIKALKNNDNDIVNAIMVRLLAIWIFSIFFLLQGFVACVHFIMDERAVVGSQQPALLASYYTLISWLYKGWNLVEQMTGTLISWLLSLRDQPLTTLMTALGSIFLYTLTRKDILQASSPFQFTLSPKQQACSSARKRMMTWYFAMLM